jgi:DNA-directed RNA polymerase alpha subunit
MTSCGTTIGMRGFCRRWGATGDFCRHEPRALQWRHRDQGVRRRWSLSVDAYATPIDVLDLSTRTDNMLKRANIATVGQLLE